ncbi:hypothetical protein LPJ66_001263 [Kickxella alabastrina]|uniref:Uncharacterized protein n=1 Tax=Kickxella alabastrina TaxID=61397 RepID=A0ACC1ITS2_9FUNG|nr:hypothetical protein LPJ66_001263 [Kickxella alabastrina]
MSFAIQSTRSLMRTTVLPRISHTISAAVAATTTTTTAAAGLAARTRMMSALGVGLGMLGDLLGEMILRAVPKQRTSHSKKRKRMAGKGLKNRYDLVPCSGCGRPKLAAHICLSCYHDIKQKLKGMKRAEEKQKQEQ